MSRTAVAYLSTENLLHNFNVIKKKAQHSKIIAMVKANAYGHGIRSVAKRLKSVADLFGVASIDEAHILRSVDVLNPIILMEGVFEKNELIDASEQGFHVVFHSLHQIEWLQNISLKKPIHAWLKVNTGLGRLGITREDAASVYKILNDSANVLKSVKILSHLACADIKDHPLTLKQDEEFKNIAQQFDTELSFCNSAGLFTLPHHHHQYVRPGLTLYGISPFAHISSKELNLKPVMTLKTSLIAIHMMHKGDSIGYGATYICDEDMPIGVIAFGYGDGYPITAKNGTPVLIKGIKCPIVGRVSMDMMMVDLRPLDSYSINDEVTLWGDGLSIEDVVTHTQDITWNMLTSIQNRVKFIWS
ncbi:MAG: alanine racemase [Proteobacteria bacterium]|nr:alanine racemase [Pseudomonadota bacterium]